MDRTEPLLAARAGSRETLAKVASAVALSETQVPVTEAIRRLGQGWVAEEALAIALYCSMRFEDDWRAGVLAAVNHDGDSDSTGSITGAILGVRLGFPAIPEAWAAQVEGAKLIEQLAWDMFAAFQEGSILSFDDYPPN